MDKLLRKHMEDASKVSEELKKNLNYIGKLDLAVDQKSLIMDWKLREFFKSYRNVSKKGRQQFRNEIEVSNFCFVFFAKKVR